MRLSRVSTLALVLGINVFGLNVFSLAAMETDSTRESVDSYKILAQWTVKVGPDSSALVRHQRSTFSEPLVVGNSVFLGAEEPYLEKRSLRTGEILDKTKLDGIPQGAWTSDGQTVFGGDSEGRLYAVDAESGLVRWQAISKGLFIAKPLLVNDLIVAVSSGGTVQAYDKHTGAWRWQQSDPQRVTSSLVGHGGPQTFLGLVITGFPSGQLQAIDPRSGDQQWSEIFLESASSAMSLNDIKSIYSDDQTLVASSFAGPLRAWRSTKGSKKLLWEKRLSLYAPALYAGGLFYVSARDGKIYALDESTGFEVWSYQTPRGLAHKPLIHDNHIWLTTTSGEIIVLSIHGELVAQRPSTETAFWSSPIATDDKHIVALSSQGIMRKLHIAKIR